MLAPRERGSGLTFPRLNKGISMGLMQEQKSAAAPLQEAHEPVLDLALQDSASLEAMTGPAV